ncbi:hypothetical protein EDB85DRAFT_1901722 [Lactarius pseudohatsudake]|nr:hypothetical protein EDB85DRAFT_1904775 [Lactarius pseudohatsudake]KAH9010731.1 hypothetical protein EDB85DRAFT_1901722 [Lactarius pseudohatsudake]
MEFLKTGAPINRFTVIPAYLQGTRDALTKELIARAFEKTGLYPVNRAVFTQDDFAPSKASSVVAHVPDSFPSEFPSSDPVEASDVDAHSELGSEYNSEEDSDFVPSDKPSDDEEPASAAEETQSNPESEATDHMAPVSGFMNVLESLETKIVHTTRSASARLNLLVGHPKTISFEEDRALTKEDMLTELRSTREKLATTHQALLAALGQLSAANAHCTSIHRELTTVWEQLINATRAKERHLKKIKARFVTSRDLRLEFDQEEVERKEHEHAAAEKDKKKEAENAAQALQIADDALNHDFTGRLATYKKDDLRALAIAISMSDKGTNSELQARILDHFQRQPDLQRNSRFSGLFTKSIRAPQRKGTAAPSNGEGVGGDAMPGGAGGGGGTDHFFPSRPGHLPHLSMPVASTSSHPIPPNYHFHQYQPSNINYSGFHAEAPGPVLPLHPPNFNIFQPHFNYNTPQ